jgi:hypothetical protein
VKLGRNGTGVTPRKITDDVALIGCDRRIYIGQAKDQRAKSFQRIDVSSTVIGTGATRGGA